MKNKKCLNLNAALGGFLLVLSLHQSSTAEMVSGTWSGIESYNVEVTPLGQPTQFYSGTQSAVFQIFKDSDFPNDQNATIQVTGAFVIPGFGNTISVFGPTVPFDPFGPTSASASLELVSPPDIGSGDFSVTYQSVGSNGLIDVGDGSALAHLTFFQEIFPVTVRATATFQTVVPEPSSIVMAASGALVVLAVALVRARRESHS